MSCRRLTLLRCVCNEWAVTWISHLQQHSFTATTDFTYHASTKCARNSSITLTHHTKMLELRLQINDENSTARISNEKKHYSIQWYTKHLQQLKTVPLATVAATGSTTRTRAVIWIMTTFVACKASVIWVKTTAWWTTTTIAVASSSTTATTTHSSTIPWLWADFTSCMLHTNSHTAYVAASKCIIKISRSSLHTVSRTIGKITAS